MFTEPLSLIHALILAILIGLALGFFTGMIATRMLKLPVRGRSILIDVILGAVTFPLAFEIVWLIPWRNTTSARTGDTIITTISTHYQHPGLIAFALAVLLPLLHELMRFRLARKRE